MKFDLVYLCLLMCFSSSVLENTTTKCITVNDCSIRVYWSTFWECDGHEPALGYTTAKTSEEHGQNPPIGLNIIEWLCYLLYLNAKYGTNSSPASPLLQGDNGVSRTGMHKKLHQCNYSCIMCALRKYKKYWSTVWRKSLTNGARMKLWRAKLWRIDCGLHRETLRGKG